MDFTQNCTLQKKKNIPVTFHSVGKLNGVNQAGVMAGEVCTGRGLRGMAVDPQGSRSRLAVDVDASGCGDGVRVGLCYCKNVPTKSTVHDGFLPKQHEGYGRAIFIFVQIIYYSYNTTTALFDVSQLHEEIRVQT